MPLKCSLQLVLLSDSCTRYNFVPKKDTVQLSFNFTTVHAMYQANFVCKLVRAFSVNAEIYAAIDFW
jgi:hypothetical protein